MLERPYNVGGGRVPPPLDPPPAPPPPPRDPTPPHPPLPMFEADSQNFASAPSVPRGFKLKHLWPAFGGGRRRTREERGPPTVPPPFQTPPPPPSNTSLGASPPSTTPEMVRHPSGSHLARQAPPRGRPTSSHHRGRGGGGATTAFHRSSTVPRGCPVIAIHTALASGAWPLVSGGPGGFEAFTMPFTCSCLHKRGLALNQQNFGGGGLAGPLFAGLQCFECGPCG